MVFDNKQGVAESLQRVPMEKRYNMLYTLQMFAGIYRDFAGKSKCGDFKFRGIACIPAIPVIFEVNQKKVWTFCIYYPNLSPFFFIVEYHFMCMFFIIDIF